ncbi:MAG: winged helix-turn-helix domain-containing protein [Syntrophobacteraceae bacterium]
MYLPKMPVRRLIELRNALIASAAPASLPAGTDVHCACESKNEIGFELQEPTVRIHIWLESEDQMFFGSGRALLLAKIDQHGSLKKAAAEMGMSYRAAWGKIKKTEKVLGFKLIEQNGCKKGGHRLTEHGQCLREKYHLWFNEVERYALKKAAEIFPWPVKGFKE